METVYYTITYYVITENWDIIKKFTSKGDVDSYLEKNPDTFQVIYREECSDDYRYGPFRVYHN